MDPDRARPALKLSTTLTSGLIFLALVLFFFSCRKKEAWIEVDPAFSQYIDAYTSGVVSKTNSITIQLSPATNITHAVGEELDQSLFDCYPAVKGKAFWLDARTIQFKPDNWLTPDIRPSFTSFTLTQSRDAPSD